MESQKSPLATPTSTIQPYSHWPASPSIFSTDDSAAGTSASEPYAQALLTCSNVGHTHSVKLERTFHTTRKIQLSWNHTHDNRQDAYTPIGVLTHAATLLCTKGLRVRGWKEKRSRFTLLFLHSSLLSLSPLPHFLWFLFLFNSRSFSFSPFELCFSCSDGVRRTGC